MITGSLIGAPQLVAKFRAMPSALKAEIDRTTDRLGLELQAIVQDDYLTGQILKVRTNRLRGSITRGAADTRSRFEGGSDYAYSYVGTNVEYGVLWEKTGIAAHDVVPVRAKALAFEIDGALLFRKRVHIPAQGPRPFLAPALEQDKSHIIAEYDALLKRVATETIKG